MAWGAVPGTLVAQMPLGFFHGNLLGLTATTAVLILRLDREKNVGRIIFQLPPGYNNVACKDRQRHCRAWVRVRSSWEGVSQR